MTRQVRCLTEQVRDFITPGSIFKIVTAVSAIRNIPDVDNITYDCNGETEFTDKVIHCYKNKSHGTENITDAFANSCNVFFSQIGVKIGAAALRKTADDMLFNKGISFDLSQSTPSVQLNSSSSESELD